MSSHGCAHQKLAALVSSPFLAVGGPSPRPTQSLERLLIPGAGRGTRPQRALELASHCGTARAGPEPTALPGPREGHGGQDCAFCLLCSLLQALGSPHSLPGVAADLAPCPRESRQTRVGVLQAGVSISNGHGSCWVILVSPPG